jgi:exoribonuclease R
MNWTLFLACSALDVEAGKRATSTYLVQRVIPMLPPLLCEQLCSLNPGVERLSFSVVWDMDQQGRYLLEVVIKICHIRSTLCL